MSAASSDAVDRFDGRSDDYARYRPSYPPEAIDAVLEGLGDPSRIVAVDVGAGTGISLRLLVARGVRAIGLEPNEGMRERAQSLGLDVRSGTARDNGVASASAGLVTAFQAYHWFADAESTRGLARLLVPGGRIALVWNLFDRGDAFTDAYCELLTEVAESAVAGGLGFDGAGISAALASGGFAHLRVREVPYVQRLNETAILGRLRSTSYAPKIGPAYDRMATALHDLVARRRAETDETEHALVHRTHVVLAELAPPAARG